MRRWIWSLLFMQACICNKTPPDGATAAADAAVDAAEAVVSEPGGLSAPIAATRAEKGGVFVAGIDVAAKAIRVQRLDATGHVVADKTILEGATWSSEADLKMVPAAGGAAITWRGKRNGKLVRQLVVVDASLATKGEPTTVSAASCATEDALWSTDGKKAESKPWADAGTKIDIPKDEDTSLVCGTHRAFALVDTADGTSVVVLGGDAGAKRQPLLEDSTFGEDEQRERAEYTVGDNLGVVRLASSGSIAVREVGGPVHALKTKIPTDDDVVAVDASAKQIVLVYTEDLADSCDAGSMVKVLALRIDRTSFDEKVVELSPGLCGREVGPFFTGALKDAMSVAWVERIPVHGSPKAPIEGLATRVVDADGNPGALTRIPQAADALVDATCDGEHCFAVALARNKVAPGVDAGKFGPPGFAQVLRYP